MFQFLAEINLLEYARSFVENGIDDIAKVQEVSDDLLDRIGVIPSEHRRYGAQDALLHATARTALGSARADADQAVRASARVFALQTQARGECRRATPGHGAHECWRPEHWPSGSAVAATTVGTTCDEQQRF